MKINKRTAAFIMAAGVLSFTWVSHALASAESMGLYTINRITSNDHIRDIHPNLNLDSTVVWERQLCDAPEGQKCPYTSPYQIFMYSPVGGSQQITFTSSDKAYPEINDEGTIVWMEHDDNDWEIWQYRNGVAVQLTSNDHDDKYPMIAANGNIAWNAFDGTDWEIHYYRADTGQTSSLTENSFGDYIGHYSETEERPYKLPSAHMTPDGKVVWMGYGELAADGSSTPAPDMEIFSFDPSSNAITQVSNNDTDDWYPQINSRGDIVWEHFDGTDFEIAYRAHFSDTVKHLSENDTEDARPQLSENGDVAWLTDDGNDFEVALFSAAAQEVKVLTNNDRDEMNLSINNLGDICWLSFETGGVPEPYTLSIYDNAIGEFYSLTSFMSGFPYPKMNDNKSITWRWSEWQGWDVSLATQNLIGISLRPRKLNKKSKRRWVKAVLEMPKEIAAEDIDATTISLKQVNGKNLDEQLLAEGRVKIADFNGDGVSDLRVAFEGHEFLEYLKPGYSQILVVGKFWDGTPFSASTKVRVKGKRKYHRDEDDDDREDKDDDHKKKKKKSKKRDRDDD